MAENLAIHFSFSFFSEINRQSPTLTKSTKCLAYHYTSCDKPELNTVCVDIFKIITLRQRLSQDFTAKSINDYRRLELIDLLRHIRMFKISNNIDQKIMHKHRISMPC